MSLWVTVHQNLANPHGSAALLESFLHRLSRSDNWHSAVPLLVLETRVAATGRSDNLTVLIRKLIQTLLYHHSYQSVSDKLEVWPSNLGLWSLLSANRTNLPWSVLITNYSLKLFDLICTFENFKFLEFCLFIFICRVETIYTIFHHDISGGILHFSGKNISIRGETGSLGGQNYHTLLFLWFCFLVFFFFCLTFFICVIFLFDNHLG